MTRKIHAYIFTVLVYVLSAGTVLVLVSSPLFHRQLLYLGSTIVGIPTQLHRKGLHVQHILRYLLIIHVARRAGSQARVCVAAAALATCGGRSDVDQLAVLEAFAVNGSGDVVLGRTVAVKCFGGRNYEKQAMRMTLHGDESQSAV